MADIVLLFVKFVKIISIEKIQYYRFITGIIVLILSISTVCFGLFNANKIKYVSYNVKSNKNLSQEIKISFIADLHLGDTGSENRLKHIVQGINSQNPDLVCITGDIFNDNYYNIQKPDIAAELLKNIKTKYGVYACFGNHDGGKTINEMIDFLEQSNIKLLNEDHVIIDGRLILIGRLDSFPIRGFGSLKRGNLSDIISKVDINLPIVVMDHNPANIKQYNNDVDLILCGHTHRGQMFPGSLFTRLMFTVDYGHYQKDSDSPHVIVTQGISTWMMPLRIGTNNEIVAVTLR